MWSCYKNKNMIQLQKIPTRGDTMKKIILVFAILLVLTGCSQNQSVNNPAQIKKGSVVLSYHDSEIPSGFDNDKCTIVFRDNQIRQISITDPEIITYKNISVGDSTQKIESSFKYENQFMDNIYMVVFNNKTEEKTDNQNKEDDWIWITYLTDENVITQIQIYDVKYGLYRK